MKITITRDEHEFDVTAAWRIIRQMLENPTSVIGLSTGETTKGMHRLVSEIHERYPFDVSRVTLFNVDEIVNIPRSYEGSCYTMIQTMLAGPLGIAADHFIMPPTESDDFEKECLRFEEKIAACGGADLQILGIGTNGHVGINQPGTPFGRKTWVSPLHPELEARVRKEAHIRPEVELGGLTRGISEIMSSRKLILVAKGEHKAEIIEKAIHGPITTDLPASVIQLHPNCEVLVDAAAGARLR